MGTKVPGGLAALLTRLQAYVVDWRFSFVPTEHAEYEPGIDRERTSDLDAANVISSVRTDWPGDFVGEEVDGKIGLKKDEDGKLVRTPRHAVLLDIDYPAYLIDSSTPGHHHLYLDVPNGVKHQDYMDLLALLAKCGIIEQGYADVSIARGHSDLRLPWVSKDDQKLHAPDQPGVDFVTSPPADAAPAPANTVDFDGHPFPTEDLRF